MSILVIGDSHVAPADDLHPPSNEHRRRILRTRGLEHLEVFYQLWCEFTQQYLPIDTQLRDEIIPPGAAPQVALQGCGE